MTSNQDEVNENADYLISEQEEVATNRQYYGKLLRQHLVGLQEKYSNNAEVKHELDVMADYLFYLYE
jgi:hypothetical protein